MVNENNSEFTQPHLAAVAALMAAGGDLPFDDKKTRTGNQRYKTKQTTILVPSGSHQPARLPRDNMGSYPLAGTPSNFLKLYDTKLEIELSTPSTNSRAKRRRIAKAEVATVGIRRRASSWFKMRQIEKVLLLSPESHEKMLAEQKEKKFPKRKARNPIPARLEKIGDEPVYG